MNLEVTSRYDGVLFVITPIQKVNESVWTVLVEVSAEGTYRFARELVAIDGSAKNFGSGLVSNFPLFIALILTVVLTLGQMKRLAFATCYLLTPLTMTVLSIGVHCTNDTMQMGVSGWTWTVLDGRSVKL